MNEQIQAGMPNSVVKHGRIGHTIYGPYYVLYMKGDRVSASVTGIRSPQACEERASEYSRIYGAPIVTPSLLSESATQDC